MNSVKYVYKSNLVSTLGVVSIGNPLIRNQHLPKVSAGKKDSSLKLELFKQTFTKIWFTKVWLG